MRVLITGATGFTGGHLARGLKARGYDVTAMVRPSTRSGRSGQAGDLERDGIATVEGDLAQPESLKPALSRGYDVVYNIAALYRQAGLPDSIYHQVNAVAVGQLIEAAAVAGVRRVVHCSTVGVHGDIEHPPADEEAPLRPGDTYQDTKLEGEQRGRDAAAAHGVDLVVVRPSGIYGPGDRRLLKLFRGVARRRFVILGDGKIFYHLTHIDDLVEGFRLAGTVPGAAGRTYILAGGEVTTLNALVGLIADVAGVQPIALHLPVWPFWAAGAACEAVCAPLGLEPPIYRRRVDFFTKSRAFDITRARRELGFAPAVDLRTGIGRTLAWYRQQGWI